MGTCARVLARFFDIFYFRPRVWPLRSRFPLHARTRHLPRPHTAPQPLTPSPIQRLSHVLREREEEIDRHDQGRGRQQRCGSCTEGKVCSVRTLGVSNLTLSSLFLSLSLLRLLPHSGDDRATSRSLENEVLRDGERDLYVKQTYSVHRNDVPPDEVPANTNANASGSSSASGSGQAEGKKEALKRKPRKWHLSEWPPLSLFFSFSFSFSRLLLCSSFLFPSRVDCEYLPRLLAPLGWPHSRLPLPADLPRARCFIT